MPQTALWFALAIIGLFAIVASIQYPAVVKRRYFFYCLVLALAGTGFYVDFRDLWGDPHQEWQITILLGSSLIVLGWIFTNEMAIHSSRKQHTINLITQFVTSDQRVKDKETIRKHLPNRIALAPTLFNYVDENHEAVVIPRHGRMCVRSMSDGGNLARRQVADTAGGRRSRDRAARP